MYYLYATAQPAPSGGGNAFGLVMLVLLFGALYFLMIRPQSKKRREAMEMQSKLGWGDEVQTIGGLRGTVVDLDPDWVTLEPSEGVHLRFARGAIARVINKVYEEEPSEPEPSESSEGEVTTQE